MAKWAALAAGGVLGVFARYGLAAWVSGLLGPAFPWGTMAVNLSGCLLIGVFDAWATGRGWLGPDGRLVLMTGFCGAYTTFSTLLLESSALLGDGQWLRALANYLGSGAAGLLLFRLGEWLGHGF